MKKRVLATVLIVAVLIGLLSCLAINSLKKADKLPAAASVLVYPLASYRDMYRLLGEPASDSSTMMSFPCCKLPCWELSNGSTLRVEFYNSWYTEEHGTEYLAYYAAVTDGEKTRVLFGDPDLSEEANLHNHRVRYYCILAGVGGVLLATGTAVLIFHRRRKQRNPADAASGEPQPDKTES